MKASRATSAMAAASLVLCAAAPLHLDLVASYPDEDEVLDASPEIVWLEFSAPPDLERSSFSIRGPEGTVELSGVEIGEAPEVLQASVLAEMPPGSYTLSWVGAPIDDHAVRGRFDFTIAAAQP